MPRSKIMFAVAIAATGAILMGTRSLQAQIPSNGVIDACVRMDRDNDEGRVARLVSADEPCRRNETRIRWNVEGATLKPFDLLADGNESGNWLGGRDSKTERRVFLGW